MRRPCVRGLHAARVAGVVATGGDTAAAVLDRLGAGELIVGREILPGVPETVVAGGPYAGMRFVQKAGAYGGEEALQAIVRWLQTVNPYFEAAVGASHRERGE